MLRSYGIKKNGILDFGQVGFSFFNKLVLPNKLLVDKDGNEYHTVIIGSQEWIVENLKVTKYADGTPIPNISNYDDWFLPSKDEVKAMNDELYLHSVGNFNVSGIHSNYWSSSEDGSNSLGAWSYDFVVNDFEYNNKYSVFKIRACRTFSSISDHPYYLLRDIGPAGGYIFYSHNNGDGTFTYKEAAPSDCISSAWSNITDQLVGGTGTAIGTGQANTTAIINQVGHTDSAAKLCDDLTSDMLWSQDITGAYCWYDNDIVNKTPYGALYNWYAVDNAHGLAPTGWRVPSDADWATLATTLGGLDIGGGKLKEIDTTNWQAPNIGATDEFGFKFLPGGERGATGTFSFKGIAGYLWLATVKDVSESYLRYILNDNVSLFTGNDDKKRGQSIRCMRDIV